MLLLLSCWYKFIAELFFLLCWLFSQLSSTSIVIRSGLILLIVITSTTEGKSLITIFCPPFQSNKQSFVMTYRETLCQENIESSHPEWVKMKKMSNKHRDEINEEEFSEANVSLWHFFLQFFSTQVLRSMHTHVVWQIEAFLCATICHVKWKKKLIKLINLMNGNCCQNLRKLKLLDMHWHFPINVWLPGT